MLNRQFPPSFKEPNLFDFNLYPFTQLKLDNNTEVYLVEGGLQDIISCEFVFEAGDWVSNQYLLSFLTNNLILNGTSKYSAYTISQNFENLGIFVSTKSNKKTASIHFQCLTKNFDKILPLFAEILIESIFSNDEIEIFKKNEISKLQINLQKCEVQAHRKISTLIYGEKHPLGIFSTPEIIQSIQREDILKFYENFYTNGNCTIFIAGKINQNTIPSLNQTIGKLSLNQSAKPVIQYTKKEFAKKIEHSINNKDGVQAAVRVGCPIVPFRHPEFNHIHILNIILGGYFGSRLMKNIREEKGYTYGIQSYIQHTHLEPSLIISTEVGRAYSLDTIKEIKNEFERLNNQLIPIEELRNVQNYILGSLLNEMDGPVQIIQIWRNHIVNNLEIKSFYETIDCIKSVTPQKMQEIANKYLCIDNFYELTIL